MFLGVVTAGGRGGINSLLLNSTRRGTTDRQPLNAVKSLDDNVDLAAHGTRAITSGFLSRDVLLQVSPLRDFHTLLLCLLFLRLLLLLFTRSRAPRRFPLPSFLLLLLLHLPLLRDAVKLRLTHSASQFLSSRFSRGFSRIAEHRGWASYPRFAPSICDYSNADDTRNSLTRRKVTRSVHENKQGIFIH